MPGTIPHQFLEVKVSAPYSFGVVDGSNGLSVYEGVMFFALGSPQFRQYVAGHRVGRKWLKRQAAQVQSTPQVQGH